MIRVVYIAGKYRHWITGTTTFDLDKMQAEMRDEERWACVVADCGHMWFAPLANSVFLEDACTLPGDEFVERDLALIRRLRPGFDIILMRPGWDTTPESKGARIEIEAAKEHGLIVAYGCQGEKEVVEYLNNLHACEAGALS